jgi:alkanesulfonate monooxygenase SsuD/methylene tetrahydromethanopterin reductase-like flavin-dependent oxidoreductase (luciferase family)
MNVPGLIKNANAQKFWLKPESGEFTTIEELDGSILAGSPDDIVRGIQRYQEIGCDLLIFDFRMRFPDWLEQIETLARDVLPRVSEPATVRA